MIPTSVAWLANLCSQHFCLFVFQRINRDSMEACFGQLPLEEVAENTSKLEACSQLLAEAILLLNASRVSNYHSKLLSSDRDGLATHRSL
jgi:hypothetical protein